MRVFFGARVRYVHVVHENAGIGAHDWVSAPRYFSRDGLERVFP